MKIEITGQAIDRPENMSIKANLHWDYLQINNGGWVAVSAGAYEIIVMNESCDLFDSMVFMDEDDLVEWLERSADDALKNEPAEYLMAAGWVDARLFDETVVGEENVNAIERAILAAIKADDEKRKEARNNGRV